MRSPAGEGESFFALPHAVEEWTSSIRKLLSEEGPSASLTLKTIGEALFDALFSGSTRKLWEQSLAFAESNNRSLGIQLQLAANDPALDGLHRLPWELLCQPHSDNFIGLNRRTPIVRSFSVPPIARPVPLQATLRVLVVSSIPRDFARIDIEPELRAIHDALTGRRAEVQFLIDPQLTRLREELLRKSFHILHFIGHGGFDASTGEGRLLFAGKDGSANPIQGQTLATVLKGIEALQLVFLNSSDSAFGIPLALIQAGIPAVLAMQSPITDSAAITFSRATYGRLAAGEPLETAVTEGRQAVRLEYPGTMEWAVPVLFNRLPANLLLARPNTAQPVGQMIGAFNDRVADEDQLGFLHYITAFSDLIESVHTQLPLTVGVFGSWGIGKSFLLEHIEKELKRRHKLRSQNSAPRVAQSARIVSRIHIVTFNAWEYSASEAIWPGLVRKIMDRLEKEVSWPFPGRFLTKFWLNLRTQWKKERIRIATVIYMASIAAISAFLLWSGKFPQAWKALLAAGVAGIAGGLLKLVSDTVANPLSQWLTKLFLDDDYGRHIGHLARIRKDLEFLESRLRTDPKKVERVLILIDDLDRCEPDKAVEMLQAVKLLLAFESFILFLGIDARIITKAIEKHYQGLLGEAGASGYEYLDKIVQIPFQIPAPGRDQVKEFLRYQLGDPQPATIEPLPDQAPPVLDDVHQDVIPANASEAQEPSVSRIVDSEAPLQEPSAGLTAFTYEELQAFQSIADCLRPNPRHLKRLINIYRLVRSLADLTGERSLLGKPGATICWVVLCAQWPRMAHEMLRRLNELDSQRETQEDFMFPEVDPLRYLLAETESSLTESEQQKESELKLLHRLVEHVEARMSWEDLRSIRRYTISFNPAIEGDRRT